MADKTFKSLAEICFIENTHRNLLIDTSQDLTLTYADGYKLIRILSQKLNNEGIQKGDIILSYTPLALESVLLCWACFYNGVVFVPVDHNWPNKLLTHILDETNPKIILTDKERLASINQTNRKNSAIVLAGRNTGYDNIPPLFEWMQDNHFSGDMLEAEVFPNDLAVILYTSGSTGIPKGVMLSQHAIINSGILVATHFGWSCEDVFMNLGDLHAMSGLRNTCFATLHVGSSFVIASSEERNNVLFVIDIIERLCISYLGTVPVVIRSLNIISSGKRQKQLSCLKAILCTGGNLAKNQLELFYHNYQKPVLNYYGLTETAGLCTSHNFETFNPTDNSIGPAVGAELRIEPEQSLYNEQGIGELLVKSDNLMSGYYQREKETAEVLKDGFFYTGDIVYKREDGCYELLGRKRNIIKNLHSELIYLEEIDNALETHSMVKEACTCSFANFEEDEKIVAFIVLETDVSISIQHTTNEIKMYLVEKLGKNRMPWCYYFEESLPRSTTGKIQRQLLKDKLNGYIQSHRQRYF